jgi:radical SAM protein with 4Fe4S-binding SPASM domain
MQEKDWIKFKNNIIENPVYVHGYPMPGHIELNLVSDCTRRCSFCPVSDPGFFDMYNKSYFPMQMLDKVLQDLVDIGFNGFIDFSGFCEPLLHPYILIFIRKIKSMLPDVKIIMITNGDLLDSNTTDNLVKAGLDVVAISVYEKESEPGFYALKEKFKDDILVLPRRRYWDGKGYGFYFSNRAGSIDQDLKNLSKSCYYPFYSMYIDLDGVVPTCIHDAWRKTVYGNIKEESIFDIWTGENFNKLRKNLIMKKRLSSCESCNVEGTLTGEVFYEAWKQIL